MDPSSATDPPEVWEISGVKVIFQNHWDSVQRRSAALGFSLGIQLTSDVDGLSDSP